MNFKIRKANKADMPAVLELVKELAVFEKEPDAVETTVEALEKAGFDEEALFKCFVAEKEGQIEGMALFYYRFSTWKGKTLHLEDLVVRENQRGTGMGSALFQKVLEFAHEQQLKRVEWVVLDWNKPAIDFYERNGATVFKDWNTVQMDEEALANYIAKRS